MTTTPSQPLPDYENPPVIEVVCGVLFKRLDTLLAPYTGLLWQKFRDTYLRCKEVSPLIPSLETFDELPAVAFGITNVPPSPRIWFEHADGKRLLQVQRDRFLHNWKKAQPEDDYPHYGSVIEMFEDCLSLFRNFLEEECLGSIEPLQYELTYVNHIPKGDGWKTLEDIGKVFPNFAWTSENDHFLPGPEGINWSTTFILPNRAGRLHVSIRSAQRMRDNHPIIRLDLTARGIGSEKTLEAMRSWFDMGHEWIVRGFADLTDQDVQKNIWRRVR